MILHRLILCLAGMLSAFAVYADGIDEILSKARGKSVSIDYSYSCVADKGRTARGNGSLVYQNGMYKLVNEPYSVYDDGQVKLTMNKSSKEAVKETSSKSGKPMGTQSILRLLGFNPKGAQVSTSSAKDGSVAGICVVLKDGTKVSATFKSVKYAPELPITAFSYDLSALGKSWMVNDLR